MNGPGWDAIVVGGGHNGLVCAAYLARGGLRTLLVERRPEVGGMAATTELAPGARVPRFAHTVGRIAPTIVSDLALTRHGLRLVQPAARVTSIRQDGPPITLWSEVGRTVAELRRISAPDADSWEPFDREVAALASVMEPLMGAAPPDPAGPSADVRRADCAQCGATTGSTAVTGASSPGSCRSRSPTGPRTASSTRACVPCSRRAASATPDWVRGMPVRRRTS